jgi:hypothetical protein
MNRREDNLRSNIGTRKAADGNGAQPSSSQPFTTLDLEFLLKQRGVEIDNFYGLSELLHAGLSKEAIGIVVELLEAGYQPDSISNCKLRLLFSWSRFSTFLFPYFSPFFFSSAEGHTERIEMNISYFLWFQLVAFVLLL